MAPGSERIAVGIALYGVLWESTSPRTGMGPVGMCRPVLILGGFLPWSCPGLRIGGTGPGGSIGYGPPAAGVVRPGDPGSSRRR